MIIDSVIWIAFKNQRDKWHEKSLSLLDKILDLPKFYITDNILTETYNFLLRKVTHEIAFDTFQFFITSKNCILLFNNEISIRGTEKILEQYPRLSYTDANIAWHTKNLGSGEVMSFDKGFDGINGIIRIFE